MAQSETELAESLHKILGLVRDRDNLFMYLQPKFINGLIEKNYIIISHEEDMSGVVLTDAGEKYYQDYVIKNN